MSDKNEIGMKNQERFESAKSAFQNLNGLGPFHELSSAISLFKYAGPRNGSFRRIRLMHLKI